jgi:hypothetical protein
MSISGQYFDLGTPCQITEAVIRNNGDEIVLDFKGEDDYTYTVAVNRESGSLFRGKAISQPGGDEANVTCRVYEDRNQGMMVLVGSHWKYPNESISYHWLAELES